MLAALLFAGCIGQDEVRDEPTPAPTASLTAAPSSAPPTTEPTPTDEATPDPAATPTAPATPAPTTAASAQPSSTAGAGSADACSGTDDNRAFFADVAAAFDWPVYCAVLPARWSVESGRYRSAGGGWMEMFYKGPNGARLELYEGAFCDDADGCVPAGSDAGSATFGDRSGTLVTADDGRHAIVVDRGEDISWLAIGEEMDAAAFQDLVAALVRVEE